MKGKKIRESNFELLRIISMFLIVLFHTLAYSGYLSKATGIMQYIVFFIKSITLVHVNSFILVTGYFQCKSEMKLSRVISINNATWFYKSIILIIFLYFGLLSTQPSKTEIFTTFLPIDFGTYWFIGCYIVLYLISPILNKAIENSSKRELQNIILILVFILSGLCLLTTDMFYGNNYGRSLSTFVLLYFIGAYFRLYPINKKKLIKDTKKLRLYCIIGIILSAIIGSIFGIIGVKLANHEGVLYQISKIFEYIYSSYSSPIVLIQTLLYFTFFTTLNFKSKKINNIASCMIGIYLIHENKFVRETLYNRIGITKINFIDVQAIMYLFLLVVLIFTICLVIEFLRKKLFKYIYNLRISKKIRDYISLQLKSKLELKW